MNTTTSKTPPAPRRFFAFFAFGLPLGLALIFFILLIFQYHQVKTLVAPSPGSIDVVIRSQDAENKVLLKALSFLSDSDTANNSDTLHMSEIELNHFIRLSPAIGEDGQAYRLLLKDDTLTLINVMSAKKLKGPVAWMVRLLKSDGWLNSRMDAQLALENGKVNLTLVKAWMNGVVAPVSHFNNDNRLDPRKMASDSTRFDEAVSKLKSIRIIKGEMLWVKRH
jgi:hypothetical protein